MNKIPELIEKRGWSKKEFIAHCALAGMSMSTAYRIARGDLNVKFTSLLTAAKVLEIDIEDLALLFHQMKKEL